MSNSETIPHLRLMPSERWQSYYMGIAFLTAMQSRDYSTQAGAVLVGKEKEPVAVGFNGPPRGFPDDHPALITERKNDYTVHAERNAIDNAGRRGRSVLGCDLYVTFKPCSGCAMGLINAGVERVFYHDGAQCHYDRLSTGRWSFDITSELFRECHIPFIPFSYNLATAFPVRMRGETYLPPSRNILDDGDPDFFV